MSSRIHYITNVKCLDILLASDVLDAADKAYFTKVRFCEQGVDWEVSIHKLSAWLSVYYKRKVILLLDEYDTPMQ